MADRLTDDVFDYLPEFMMTENIRIALTTFLISHNFTVTVSWLFIHLYIFLLLLRVSPSTIILLETLELKEEHQNFIVRINVSPF